ncbi:MAG TPA: hypothetical protein VKO84_10030, partial [Gaiellaceae bacterium]|nr:hypothetical protein [Gaiellaceae bacterium]
MGDTESSASLERYLSTARPIQAFRHSMGGGGHPDSFLAVLEGGVTVLAKPETSEPTGQMARREAAAWVIAKAL